MHISRNVFDHVFIGNTKHVGYISWALNSSIMHLYMHRIFFHSDPHICLPLSQWTQYTILHKGFASPVPVRQESHYTHRRNSCPFSNTKSSYSSPLVTESRREAWCAAGLPRFCSSVRCAALRPGLGSLDLALHTMETQADALAPGCAYSAFW